MTKIYHSQLIHGSISSQMIRFNESEGLRKHYLYIYIHHILIFIYIYIVFLCIFREISFQFHIPSTDGAGWRGFSLIRRDTLTDWSRNLPLTRSEASSGGWFILPKKPEILFIFSMKHPILGLSNFDPYPSGCVQPSH